MDLSTNIEQSHVKQRIARFYQQTAANESNNNQVTNEHIHSLTINNQQQQQQQPNQLNHSNSNNSGSAAAAGAGTGTGSIQANRLNVVLTSGNRHHLTPSSASTNSSTNNSTTVNDHHNGPINQWNEGKNHSQSVPTITSSSVNGMTGNQGQLHHSLTPSQCSLSSPPPPESPAMSGISSSASNSSISSPCSRQMDTETSVGGYTSIASSQSGNKKRKRRPQPIPDNCKDDAYWERRKRNNESAKRSRELRRYKEQQTTMRVIYLEQDNLKLKTEVDMLRTELEKLREILFNRNNNFH